MSDIKLFSTTAEVVELLATSITLEKELQILIEKNMNTFFGVTFLDSEFQITNGRIDSLGIDENNCPVIFEYKRSINENVINQGLFYLDWLLDHKADFKLLVMGKLGNEKAKNVDWSIPCVICIANDFTKFDVHAVNQMQKNIKLVKYKKFGSDLILFEHINVPMLNNIANSTDMISNTKSSSDKTFLQQFDGAPDNLQNIYITIKNYILSLGDDVTENQLKLYVAFKKVKNILCVEIYQGKILLTLKLDPNSVILVHGFTRDVSKVGHFGTGNLQVTIKSIEDFERAKSLIDRVYNEN